MVHNKCENDWKKINTPPKIEYTEKYTIPTNNIYDDEKDNDK